jgi:outer membrane lipoprotein-sorting protein
MKFLLILTIFFTSVTGWAQDGQARKILDKLSQKFDTYRTLELHLDLEIFYPEEDSEKRNVQLIQSGDKFFFDTENQQMIGDGQSVWYILKNRNEVQISDYDGEEDLGVPTPSFILQEYKAGQFEAALVSNNMQIAEIDLKPTEDSDYSKLKILIHTKGNELKEVTAYGKDGSRVHLVLISIKPNVDYTSDTFTFSAADFPGIFIEDLRID